LLTEAFYLLGMSYSEHPRVGLELCRVLADAAGVRGMIGGQAIDIRAQETIQSVEGLERMHRLKTGKLISASVDGAAVLANVSGEERKLWQQFAEELGLAFQIADDLLDAETENKAELSKSYVGFLGRNGALQELSRRSQQALGYLRKTGRQSSELEMIIKYNEQRTH
ncbi:MAG: polyprenyl synthetase family protein, partial [Bdellovibrionaceae bacterium]|nr:polyprenyl synthetase family protein [Pseudobdellovibrionaceae bacterium]